MIRWLARNAAFRKKCQCKLIERIGKGWRICPILLCPGQDTINPLPPGIEVGHLEHPLGNDRIAVVLPILDILDCHLTGQSTWRRDLQTIVIDCK